MEELVSDLLTLAREGDGSLDRERVELAGVAERSWAGVETGGARFEFSSVDTA